MPQIIVAADRGAAFGEGAVTFRERVNIADFESAHFANQLVERLGWAVEDADRAERIPGESDGSDRREQVSAESGVSDQNEQLSVEPEDSDQIVRKLPADPRSRTQPNGAAASR
jgi:hypothetical protein